MWTPKKKKREEGSQPIAVRSSCSISHHCLVLCVLLFFSIIFLPFSFKVIWITLNLRKRTMKEKHHFSTKKRERSPIIIIIIIIIELTLSATILCYPHMRAHTHRPATNAMGLTGHWWNSSRNPKKEWMRQRAHTHTHTERERKTKKKEIGKDALFPHNITNKSRWWVHYTHTHTHAHTPQKKKESVHLCV